MKTIAKHALRITAAAAIALSAGAALAENPMVGGAAMYENKNIVDNVRDSTRRPRTMSIPADS